jgi:hypothetical protein
MYGITWLVVEPDSWVIGLESVNVPEEPDLQDPLQVVSALGTARDPRAAAFGYKPRTRVSVSTKSGVLNYPVSIWTRYLNSFGWPNHQVC